MLTNKNITVEDVVHFIDQTFSLPYLPVGFVTSHELFNKLNDGVINPYIHDPEYMLLLDVRPQNSYLHNHILIAKQWNMVENNVKWLLSPSSFLSDFTYIVVYDEASLRDNLSEGITTLDMFD